MLTSSYSIVPLERIIIIGSGVAWTAAGLFFLVPIYCMNQSACFRPTESKVSGTMWLDEPTQDESQSKCGCQTHKHRLRKFSYCLRVD